MLSSEKDLVEVEILISKTCPYCPAALKMVREAQKIFTDNLNVLEIDIESEGGQLRADMYSVQGTPAVAINGTMVFRGVPSSQRALNGEIEKHLSEEAKLKAKKKEKQRKDRLNLMYG